MTVELEGVSKVFPDGTAALRDLDLVAVEGELLVMVGPSGSGKSTVLRIVSGLESPTAGRVRIGDVDVTELEPQQRDVAMVFQSYALYPHKTVRENLALPLRVRRLPANQVTERVEQVARMLEIAEHLDRRPAQLSGGQRQRVALGRAVVRQPRAFLLDEPLSNLDPALRQHTRAQLARLHRSLGVTTLYVTHDQEEAMTLGDRVAVLRGGTLEQLAPPLELYHAPATRFVASFIGSPAMNLALCRVERSGDLVRLRGGGIALELTPRLAPGDLASHAEVVLGIRPHDVATASAQAGHYTGIVDLLEPRGSDIVGRLRAVTQEGPNAASAGPEGGGLDVVLPADSPAREGDLLVMRLPPDRLHFFDAKTGARLR